MLFRNFGLIVSQPGGEESFNLLIRHSMPLGSISIGYIGDGLRHCVMGGKALVNDEKLETKTSFRTDAHCSEAITFPASSMRLIVLSSLGFDDAPEFFSISLKHGREGVF